ncbi:MAG: hypothetical protein ABI267_06215 [Ginsengibacter sp.]
MKYPRVSIINKSYREVLLIVRNPGFSDTGDSVFLANNTEIVGFKYYGEHYNIEMTLRPLLKYLLQNKVLQ